MDLAGRGRDRERKDVLFCHAALRDAHGTVVPDAWENVAFGVTGAATLLGTNPPSTDAGIASILVETRPGRAPAAIYALAMPGGTAPPLGAVLGLDGNPVRHELRRTAAGAELTGAWPGRRLTRVRPAENPDGGQRAAGSS